MNLGQQTLVFLNFLGYSNTVLLFLFTYEPRECEAVSMHLSTPTFNTHYLNPKPFLNQAPSILRKYSLTVHELYSVPLSEKMSIKCMNFNYSCIQLSLITIEKEMYASGCHFARVNQIMNHLNHLN